MGVGLELGGPPGLQGWGAMGRPPGARGSQCEKPATCLTHHARLRTGRLSAVDRAGGWRTPEAACTARPGTSARRSPGRHPPLQAARVARLGGVGEAEPHTHRLVALVALHAAQGVVQLIPHLLLRQQRQQAVRGGSEEARGHGVGRV